MHSLFIVNSFHTAQSALRVSDSGKNKNTRDDGSAFRQNKHPGDCPWICVLDGMQKNRMKYLQWLRYLTTPQILDVFTRFFFFFFKVLETVLGSHNNVVKRLGSCHLPIPTPGPFPCFLFPLLHKCQQTKMTMLFPVFMPCPSLSSFQRTRRDFLLFQTHSNLESCAAQL